jgi:hypothetical protein
VTQERASPHPPELIHRFLEPLWDAEGAAYEVRVLALERSDGTWIAWLEFTDPTSRILKTDRETTQSSAEQVQYWAQGLEPTYLEGALDRAKRS